MACAPLSSDRVDTRAMLEAAATVHADIEAYVEPGARITFAEWIGRARGVAAQFADLGVGKGDVVTLWLPSGIDYATCYAAAAMIGAITTGLNPRLGRREIESILQQADPALIVADEQLGALPDTEHRLLSRDALRADTSRSAPPAVELTRRDLVALIFTSGTTGTPKGAAFDADRLAAGAAASGVMSAPHDRRLTSTPFSHAGYMFKLWDQLVCGSTLVVPPTPWSAQGMFDVLREERVTVAGAVPTQWAKLLEVDGVSPKALPHLRIGIVATASAPPELVRRAAAGMDVRIGPDGVVEVSGPCVMRGYWRNPELTAAVLRDGWLRTGDVGVLGDDGNLTLVGRSGDMYIRGGYNVHPGEVERTLGGHPGVKQAAVIGRSAPVIGEIGVAFVVPADNANPPTLQELRAFVSRHIADYKAPDDMVIIDQLPLTAMLKPDRTALRDLATQLAPSRRG